MARHVNDMRDAPGSFILGTGIYVFLLDGFCKIHLRRQKNEPSIFVPLHLLINIVRVGTAVP